MSLPSINEALVFSSDPASGDRLAQAIESAVHRVVLIDTPEKLLSRVDNGSPDAVLVDLTRESQTGLSLTRQLRRSQPNLSILAVARYKDPDLILAAVRAGMSDFLVLEENGAELCGDLQRALDRAAGSRRTGDLIAVYSLKGGQGVTTVAVNLADQLQALTGRKVLLADLNLYRGDAAAFLDQPCTFTPFELVRDLARMDSHLLFSSLIRHKNRFYLLGTADDIGDADQITPEDLRAMVDLLRQHFDTIVLDLPSDCSPKTIEVLEAADRIVLVAQQTVPEVKNLQSVLEFFREIHPNDDRLGMVINRYDPSSDLTAPDLSDLLGCPVIATISSDYRSLARAIDQGKTIATAAPQKRINRDFKRLAARMNGMDTDDGRRPLIDSIATAITGWRRSGVRKATLAAKEAAGRQAATGGRS